MRRFVVCLSITVLTAPFARGHHVTDFVVTSERDGGGQLLVSYDFEATTAPVAFSFGADGLSVFTGTNPGFDTADGDEFFPGTQVPYPIFAPGVSIFVELIDNDGGRTAMKLGGVTLRSPGDRALVGVSGAQPPGDLHKHPEWTLLSSAPPETFVEGRIAFRITSDGAAFDTSRTYTLRLTNGHLAAPQYDGDRYDRASVACQATVGAAVAAYAASVHDALRHCLDRVQTARAQLVAGLDTTRADGAATKACASERGPDGATLLGRIARARQRAFAGIQRACGAARSGDYADEAIEQMLGLARCRTEETVAASYFRARTYLARFATRASQGGGALADHLPCLRRTAGEEEGRS